MDIIKPNLGFTPDEVENRKQALNDLESLKLRSLAETAEWYIPSEELIAAMNAAIALEKPLLLLGEPGTGKTQAAFYLAKIFGLIKPLQFSVRSTSTYQQLFYHFDGIRYFRDAQLAPKREKSADDVVKEKSRAPYIEPGPLWKAMVGQQPQVLLIDEIDKAHRDFPNDLLNALDQYEFEVPELYGCLDVSNTELEGAQPRDNNSWFVGKADKQQRAPIVVITSNQVEQLPEPFLRRCIFHYIEFSEFHFDQVTSLHQKLQKIDEQLLQLAKEKFMEIRKENLFKKPSTAEFLEWVYRLNQDAEENLKTLQRAEIPEIHILIKSNEDKLKVTKS